MRCPSASPHISALGWKFPLSTGTWSEPLDSQTRGGPRCPHLLRAQPRRVLIRRLQHPIPENSSPMGQDSSSCKFQKPSPNWPSSNFELDWPSRLKGAGIRPWGLQDLRAVVLSFSLLSSSFGFIFRSSFGSVVWAARFKPRAKRNPGGVMGPAGCQRLARGCSDLSGPGFPFCKSREGVSATPRQFLQRKSHCAKLRCHTQQTENAGCLVGAEFQINNE